MGTSKRHRVPAAQTQALSASLAAAAYPPRDCVSRWFGHSSATAPLFLACRLRAFAAAVTERDDDGPRGGVVGSARATRRDAMPRFSWPANRAHEPEHSRGGLPAGCPPVAGSQRATRAYLALPERLAPLRALRLCGTGDARVEGDGPVGMIELAAEVLTDKRTGNNGRQFAKRKGL